MGQPQWDDAQPLAGFAEQNLSTGYEEMQDQVLEEVPEAAMPSGSAADPSNQAGRPQNNRQAVAVWRVHHTFKPDEFCYKNKKNDTVTTQRGDWKNKHGVWEHRGRKTIYYTKNLP